jgi:hypothetical protein
MAYVRSVTGAGASLSHVGHLDLGALDAQHVLQDEAHRLPLHRVKLKPQPKRCYKTIVKLKIQPERYYKTIVKLKPQPKRCYKTTECQRTF